jgi:hypothetical protein
MIISSLILILNVPQVSVEQSTYITQNITNYYIYYTNYYKLTTTITKYLWIYLHPEVIIVIVVIGVRAHVAGWCFQGSWLRQW